MIKKWTNLDDELGRQVKDLINECEEYDQAIIPIQFDHSLNYFPEMRSWFLCFEEGVLIGLISVFSPLSEVAEISGCIKPSERRKGRFSELLRCCRDELNSYKIVTVLFPVDNNSMPAMAIIRKLSLKCDHTEYMMKYGSLKDEYSSSLQLRQADSGDVEDFSRINAELFHETYEESKNMIMSCLQSKERKLYMATLRDKTIGICTLFYAGSQVVIYGLGISEAYQEKVMVMTLSTLFLIC